MRGNFIYYNPTKIYFGKDSFDYLSKELDSYGKKILLVYGKNSIKSNGIYSDVLKILKKHKKSIKEVSGVMSNPTLSKVYEGLEVTKTFKPDLILAIGGGSVIDYAKTLSASIYEKQPSKIWQNYFVNGKDPRHKVVKIGCILTMVGTGSESNGGSVITNDKIKVKLGHVFSRPDLIPEFAILNPVYTYTVPHKQMIAGIFDIFSHLCEQYFSNHDDNTSDYLIEGLMRSTISSSLKAVKNEKDYEARSNIMWCATWSLNRFVGCSKNQDWMVHNIGHAISAVTNATHGLTLAAVSLAYYRYMLKFEVDKFVRFAINVFNINSKNKSKLAIAKAGLSAMEHWMKNIGVNVSLKDLGVKDKLDIDNILKATVISGCGYKKLSKQEVKQILLKSL